MNQLSKKKIKVIHWDEPTFQKNFKAIHWDEPTFQKKNSK